MKNQNRILLVVLPLIVLVCFSVWLVQTDLPSRILSSSDGEWDLRQFDFSANAVRLSGDVAYIPDRMVPPEQFDENPGLIETGRPETVSNVSTSRMRLFVPDGSYMLLIRTVDYADRIYVNGKWMAGAGVPSETPESFQADKRNVLFTVEPENGVIEIVQQTANFVHKDSGYHTNITVGRAAVVQNIYARLLGSTAVIAGCFLALFITHIALFLLLHSYTVNLYAALFCLVWCLRTGITGIRLLPSMLPSLPWVLFFRVEYLSLPLGCVLIVLTLHGLFPAIFPRWFHQSMSVISALFIAVCLFGDTLSMSVILPYYQFVLGAGIAFVFARFAWKLRRPTLEQAALLAGICFLLYAFAHEMLFYRKAFDSLNQSVFNNSILSLALLVYIFVQTTVVIFGTVREVADVRLREKRLADENAALDRINRMKTDLMATISHETRTPLAVLSGYAGLISVELRAKGVDEQTAKDLDKIAFETQRIAGMMEEMHKLSRKRDSDTKHDTVDLADAARQTGRLYAPILERRGVALTLDIADDLPLVYGNPEELTQVVFNLLQNAKEHTESGTVTLAVRSDGARVSVTVSDSGAGIDAELLPHVYERYTSGHTGGSGLGLPICKEIIEAHGGTMTIESEIHKGTAVTFTLPVHGRDMDNG